MKHKTAELKGDALDYMVQCAQRGEKPLCSVAEWKAGSDDGRSPSTYWEHGGPIIERQKIGLVFQDGQWMAGDLYTWPTYYETTIEAHDAGYGPTPLIAAMRAYVTSVFGEEVEIP